MPAKVFCNSPEMLVGEVVDVPLVVGLRPAALVVPTRLLVEVVGDVLESPAP